MPRLRKDEIVTIHVLKDKSESNRAVARLMGVSEAAVRYHLRKAGEGRGDADGRRDKPFKARDCHEAIAGWLEAHGDGDGERACNCRELHQWLVEHCGYGGSHRSVWRYVRRHFPQPPRRPYRRVELPPGVQVQIDWCERTILVGGAARRLYGLCLQLSHSRMEALVWSESMDQLHWQQCHNAGFRRLGGVAATARIDNLKTGMAKAGPHGRVNPVYRRYAQAAGFHVDACQARHPQAKGKVERRIGALAGALLRHYPRGFDSLEQLQTATDAWIAAQAQRRRCPATGTSVAEAWAAERPLLRGCEALPEVFDTVVTRRVKNDCTIAFEGRTYSVPFHLAWQSVEVRGEAGHVSIWHEGRPVARHRRGGPELIVLDERHFSGGATPTHLPPLPLGRLGRRALELAEAPVQLRSVDYYHALAEVGS
ncbi:MAG: IS21 family transposase [Puniceicoccaceae bacterium]|nr:MAG: IS21 family transposase [Puniceicoccaceae bacterium]